jgi:carboxyl-terminal processing protease
MQEKVSKINDTEIVIESTEITLESVGENNFKKNRSLFNKYLLFFVVIFLFFGTFYGGYKMGQKNSSSAEIKEKTIPIDQAYIDNKLPNSDNKIDFSLFWKVWDLVRQKHIAKNSLDAQKMVYGAINGMLKATGDPYSYFFSPEESKSFTQDIEGSFEGIGAELGMKDNVLTVVAPLEGSPAQKAGLMAGDKIFKIDGKVSADMSIDEAVDMVRGKKGTSVKLTVLRSGEQETKDISITRDVIEVKSVKLDFKDNNIAHLKITKFGENTDKEFADAANQIISRETKGIILDLRNDPGGLLDKAVNIASKFIPKGQVVVSEEDSQGNKENLRTLGGDKLNGIPMVILINEGSASASEILAGALRDDQNITLIGKKSFGKGSVQELISLPENSSVKITVAKWLTPKGDYIMEKGISPDIEVNLTADDFINNRDPQLDKAMEVLKEKIK